MLWLSFRDNISSLKTACPHSLYRPFKLDRCSPDSPSLHFSRQRGVKCSFINQTIRWTSPSLHSFLTNKYSQTNRKASRQLKYKNITRTFFFFWFCDFFFSSNFLDARIGFRNVSCLKMNQLS